MGKQVLFFVLLVSYAMGLELRNGAYEDFVIKVSDSVPVDDCKLILDKLEATLTSASQYLFAALNSRAYLRSTTVVLPSSWPDSCLQSNRQIFGSSGEKSDLTIQNDVSARGRIFTQQSLGCGQPGDQIYLSASALKREDAGLGRVMVKQFAMYRYGVFEEQGYANDPIYPICYVNDVDKTTRITSCSDAVFNDTSICEGTETYNTTKLIAVEARSSIMFAPEGPNVSMFCDEGNHDRYAPTKHNSMCEGRSVLDVILNHSDFSTANIPLTNTNLINTKPNIVYKRANLTRYVFVLENTKDMMQRESWLYLRRAIRHWTLNILPDNTEVGMVLAEEGAKRALNLVSVNNRNSNENNNRDKFYSSIPYTSGDSIQPGCLHCALKEALEMLQERTKSHGAGNNVIVVIGAGYEPNEQIERVIHDAKRNKIRIATINYPTILRTELLNHLADETNGVSYTVFELKLNSEMTLFTTYFELINVLVDITRRFHSGSQSKLSMEIYRRQFIDDGNLSITGTFELDSSMGVPSQVAFFTYNTDTPLIKSLKLTSPNQEVFTERSDRFIDYKMFVSTANISQPGAWTWTVELYPGSPHPHFMQVTATPTSIKAPVVRARFWTHRTNGKGPLILLVEVKRGEVPVLDARVEVRVTKPELNGTVINVDSIRLLDTGAGDPDITKDDGVYTRYFDDSGPGLYNFEAIVSDNGNAYVSGESSKIEPCCGSRVPVAAPATVSRFQRVLPKVTIRLTDEQISAARLYSSVGRIGDLRADVIDELKVKLSWTSPDIGGQSVSRYEVKYGMSVDDVFKFETKAKDWLIGSPFVLPSGSGSTFTLDFARSLHLLDTPLYFAIKSFSMVSTGAVSNWVRVLVRSPPKPSTSPPIQNHNSFGSSGDYDQQNAGVAAVKNGVGLELILPIVIGLIILVVLLLLYCYFCVVKRRNHSDNHKKSSDSINKNDKLSSTITIVPSTPQNIQHYVEANQVGVPTYDYEEETKKRYSLVHQQEQQLIEELKQQQMAHLQGTPNAGYVSVISNGTMNRAHTLSPYNSWSASQLLHEHERRHSPNMDEQHANELLMSTEIDHYGNQVHVPPPVPPLPAFTSNGYPVNYNIYGVHPGQGQQIYQSMGREQMVPFNPSLQGSVSSVNSGEKKRRNVTMV